MPNALNSVINETTIRVRYVETDQMGVVYHSNYLIWFEVGRVELMRQMGFTYKRMEQEDGCYIAVADMKCRFKAPARYDDEIIVRTRLANVRSSMIHFGYEILRCRDGALLAEGETVHLVTDSGFNRRALPEKYMTAFKAAVVRNGRHG